MAYRYRLPRGYYGLPTPCADEYGDTIRTFSPVELEDARSRGWDITPDMVSAEKWVAAEMIRRRKLADLPDVRPEAPAVGEAAA